jgi:hypothetical protein
MSAIIKQGSYPALRKLLNISILIAIIIIAAAAIRIRVYGDIRLSIASNDTDSYVEAAQTPLFSAEIMTGRRPLTTNLLYKAFEPKEGYEILVNGSIDTTRRNFQPGFDRIVVLQLILSLIGWGGLAYVLAEHIKNPIMKVLMTTTIVAFAFTPQIADWDSVLMSESLTFSLFALHFAIFAKLAFIIHKGSGKHTTVYTAIWAVTCFLWTFLRDTNLFVSVVTFAMASGLLFLKQFQKNKSIRFMLLFSAGIVGLGLITAGNSTRSLVQTSHVFESDLLSSPSRVATLRELGMPEPHTAEYDAWFQENASRTLVKVLLIHPGYALEKIARDFPRSFTNADQTYFKAPEQTQAREVLMTMGVALHSENTTPFLMNILLLIGLVLIAIKSREPSAQIWAWLGIWLFLSASITICVTILGDAWALNRHTIFSTMLYRLSTWIFAIIIMDAAIEQKSRLEI